MRRPTSTITRRQAMSSTDIDSILIENRQFEPPAAFAAAARLDSKALAVLAQIGVIRGVLKSRPQARPAERARVPTPAPVEKPTGAAPEDARDLPTRPVVVTEPPVPEAEP